MNLKPEAAPFGTVNGERVCAYRISDGRVSLTATNYGALITQMEVPSRAGMLDVVLGFDDAGAYLRSQHLPAPPYFGAVAGRYAGRIKDGRFNLDGQSHWLKTNDRGNTLHGGLSGFNSKIWKLENHTDRHVAFSHHSPDGDQGFPAALDVTVTYSICDDGIVIEYTATTDGQTVVNLTQHSYFNLDGHTGNVRGQRLTLNSREILEIDGEIVPTGKIIPAGSKGFDFLGGGICPEHIDDTFLIRDISRPAAILESEKSGVRLTVSSDQPSLQVYVGGNCFGEVPGKGGAAYHRLSGICLESQHYPDSPNKPDFPTTQLRRGETYKQRTVWKFDTF